MFLYVCMFSGWSQIFSSKKKLLTSNFFAEKTSQVQSLILLGHPNLSDLWVGPELIYRIVCLKGKEIFVIGFLYSREE